MFDSIPEEGGTGQFEPTFTLRAQDVSAAAIIQVWITMNPQIGPEKLIEAQKTLEAFRAWPKKKKAD